ncbi:MAG TPA: 50S ribosomal protein L4 [Actinomycetota bacterium]|nr:50S ribosomal protein L4 [Actinomycetota bacterium]
MSVATYVDGEGAQAGTVSLPDEIFDVDPNVPVMHAVVRAHLAAIRAGTHSTKTRAEVRGGGRKPWRQKGTGRARHGSIREPQWVGGGIAHGPKPRDYTFSLTKKTRALALKGALSDRAREGSIVVVDLPAFEEPKTKRAVELLERWVAGGEGRASGKVLIVTGQRDPAEHIDTWKSFRNLPNVLMVQVPTTYRVLAADVVVLTREALAEITKSDIALQAAAAASEPVLEAPAETVPEDERDESPLVPEAGGSE